MKGAYCLYSFHANRIKPPQQVVAVNEEGNSVKSNKNIGDDDENNSNNNSNANNNNGNNNGNNKTNRANSNTSSSTNSTTTTTTINNNNNNNNSNNNNSHTNEPVSAVEEFLTRSTSVANSDFSLTLIASSLCIESEQEFKMFLVQTLSSNKRKLLRSSDFSEGNTITLPQFVTKQMFSSLSSSSSTSSLSSSGRSQSHPSQSHLSQSQSQSQSQPIGEAIAFYTLLKGKISLSSLLKGKINETLYKDNVKPNDKESKEKEEQEQKPREEDDDENDEPLNNSDIYRSDEYLLCLINYTENESEVVSSSTTRLTSTPAAAASMSKPKQVPSNTTVSNKSGSNNSNNNNKNSSNNSNNSGDKDPSIFDLFRADVDEFTLQLCSQLPARLPDETTSMNYLGPDWHANLGQTSADFVIPATAQSPVLSAWLARATPSVLTLLDNWMSFCFQYFVKCVKSLPVDTLERLLYASFCGSPIDVIVHFESDALSAFGACVRDLAKFLQATDFSTFLTVNDEERLNSSTDSNDENNNSSNDKNSVFENGQVSTNNNFDNSNINNSNSNSNSNNNNNDNNDNNDNNNNDNRNNVEQFFRKLSTELKSIKPSNVSVFALERVSSESSPFDSSKFTNSEFLKNPNTKVLIDQLRSIKLSQDLFSVLNSAIDSFLLSPSTVLHVYQTKFSSDSENSNSSSNSNNSNNNGNSNSNSNTPAYSEMNFDLSPSFRYGNNNNNNIKNNSNNYQNNNNNINNNHNYRIYKVPLFCHELAINLRLNATGDAHPILLRRILESQRNEILMEINNFKKLLRQAEIDNYALYQTLDFIRNSKYGLVLVRAIISYATTSLTNEEKHDLVILLEILTE